MHSLQQLFQLYSVQLIIDVMEVKRKYESVWFGQSWCLLAVLMSAELQHSAAGTPYKKMLYDQIHISTAIRWLMR